MNSRRNSISPAKVAFTSALAVVTLSWPADHTGWRLQVQTNGLATGLSSNWFDVAGSSLGNSMVIPVDNPSGSVFYRLIHP